MSDSALIRVVFDAAKATLQLRAPSFTTDIILPAQHEIIGAAQALLALSVRERTADAVRLLTDFGLPTEYFMGDSHVPVLIVHISVEAAFVITLDKILPIVPDHEG